MIARCILPIAITIFLAGCAGDQFGGGCDSPDNMTYVAGSAHCFGIRTHVPKSGSAKTLVVALHGDMSGGGDPNYIISPIIEAYILGAIGVAMARPGYAIDGRESSGVPTRSQHRNDKMTLSEISSIASAVATLKKHHGAERVVMVGHSGGAIVSGVMLGSAAPLVDAAILVSCPCDIQAWRSSRGGEWENAASPSDFLSFVPKSARIYALTGEYDNNTHPQLARDYVKNAKDAGLNATFFLVKSASHGYEDLGESPEFMKALKSAITE